MFCLIITILTLRSTAHGLLGFDCGGQHLNVTSISLLDTGDCNLDVTTPNSTDIYIQLLQLSDYDHAEVIQCKIEIARIIYHCGMHSHISAVHNGHANYLHETGYTVCKRLFNDGTMRLGAAEVMEGIKPNRTTTRSVTLAGAVNTDGTCKGTQYSDPYGTWMDVIVQASVRITLKSSYVPVQVNTGKITLKSGTVCELKEGFCLDSDDGYTYWKPLPTLACNFHHYDVLYEGIATRMQANIDDPASPIVYSLVTHDITFALTKTKEQNICGYTLFATEHPKLFILETKRGDTFSKLGPVPVDNLDIFVYVNSKFIYVEKHIRDQVTTLYYNVMKQKCELERQVITNALSFATLLPDEFAYRLMKKPGFMAVTAGEAIHIIKCIPLDVIVRKTNECYAELPVTLRNTSLFLTPKSRILTKFGTLKECSNELPTLYRIEDTWIQLTPHPQVRQLIPQQLKPMTKLTWKYLTPGPLAVSGIYSQTDIEKLRDHIMFPAEKPALINNVLRGLTGYSMESGSVSMYNLLDEQSINQIAENAASRVWKGFINFGSATAGVLGILLIIRVAKLLIDTLIHGYALHTVYGCSLHLIGAIWSSITHLLLHLAKIPGKESIGGDNNSPSAPTVPSSPPALAADPSKCPLSAAYMRMESPRPSPRSSETYAIPVRRNPPLPSDGSPDIIDDYPMRPQCIGKPTRKNSPPPSRKINGLIVIPASRTSIDEATSSPRVYTDLRERLNNIEQIPTKHRDLVLNKEGGVTSG